MTDHLETNPYSPPLPQENVPFSWSSLVISTLLFLVALNLILHGIWMAREYTEQFRSTNDWSRAFATSFYPAMYLKDAITGLTALVGGIAILFRRPLGWWLSMIHWNWYLTWKVTVVLVADMLSWSMPIRDSEGKSHLHDELPIAFWSIVAVAFLSSTHVMNLLKAKRDQRGWRITALFLLTTALAFLINWWSMKR